MVKLVRLYKIFFTLGIGSFLSILGPSLGIGSSLGLFGGGSGGNSGAMGGNAYVPTGRGTADQTWQQGLQSLFGNINNQSGMLTPNLQTGYTNATNEFNALGPAMQNFGQTLTNNATGAFTNAGNLQAGGNALYQMGMDPQNAYRDQLRQQTQDQANASTSMRGIGMGGEAAGIANQADTNFLNQWQNQQMNRAAQGLQGATGAYNAAGQQSQLGNADLTGAVNMFQGAAGLPFQAANMYSGANQQANLSPYSGLMSSIMPYMNFGMNSAQNAFGNQQTNLNNLSTGISQLGSGGGGSWLSSLFGGGGGGGGANQGISAPGDLNAVYNPGGGT